MRSVLAVAGLTLRAVLRTRVAAAVFLLLLMVGLALPPALRDDGTLAGRLQLVIAYTLTAAQAVLALAAVWLAADNLGGEIAGRQLWLALSRPVARWQIWLGKWLGLVLLCGGLLAMAGGLVAGQVAVAVGAPRWDAADRDAAAARILTARVDVAATQPDLAAAVEQRLSERLAAGDLRADDNLAAARRLLADELAAEWRGVSPGQRREWRFGPIRPPAEVDELELRCRPRVAEFVGAAGVASHWVIGGATGTSASVTLRPDQWQTFAVDRELVGAGGELVVSVENRGEAAIVFASLDGPLVSYPAGGFAGNLLRSLLVIWLQLGLLVAVGLFAGGAFSFPVAAMLTIGYLLVALHAPLLAGAIDSGLPLLASHHGDLAPAWQETLAQAGVRFGLWLTSGLHRANPIGDLAAGLLVGWDRVGQAVALVGLLQTGLVAGLGVLMFGQRELGLAEGQ